MYSERIKPYNSEIKVVMKYPVPQSITQLHQFLELANYYHKFVIGYASIAESLHKLTRKSAKSVCTSESQEDFKALKLP